MPQLIPATNHGTIYSGTRGLHPVQPVNLLFIGDSASFHLDWRREYVKGLLIRQSFLKWKDRFFVNLGKLIMWWNRPYIVCMYFNYKSTLYWFFGAGKQLHNYFWLYYILPLFERISAQVEFIYIFQLLFKWYTHILWNSFRIFFYFCIKVLYLVEIYWFERLMNKLSCLKIWNILKKSLWL